VFPVLNPKKSGNYKFESPEKPTKIQNPTMKNP
jgi:hypothetical protein